MSRQVEWSGDTVVFIARMEYLWSSPRKKIFHMRGWDDVALALEVWHGGESHFRTRLGDQEIPGPKNPHFQQTPGERKRNFLLDYHRLHRSTGQAWPGRSRTARAFSIVRLRTRTISIVAADYIHVADVQMYDTKMHEWPLSVQYHLKDLPYPANSRLDILCSLRCDPVAGGPVLHPSDEGSTACADRGYSDDRDSST